MAFDWDDEPVGYRKPPRWTQFRPGQSGNPKGRPRKKRDAAPVVTDSLADDILRAELDREIRVSDAEGSRMMSMAQIVARSQITAAAKGNPTAQRDLLRRQRELETRDAARRQAEEEERRAEFEKMVRFKQVLTMVWDEALTAGKEEPETPWPHPDDVIIDEARMTWKIRGPLDESDVPRFDYYSAMRDAGLLRWEIKNRQGCSTAGLYLPIAMSFDALLPWRWQILGDEGGSHRTTLSLAIMTLPRLKKQLRITEMEIETLESVANLPPRDSDSYRTVNSVMKPLLKHFGYCSLAEFERVYEAQGDSMPLMMIGPHRVVRVDC